MTKKIRLTKWQKAILKDQGITLEDIIGYIRNDSGGEPTIEEIRDSIEIFTTK